LRTDSGVPLQASRANIGPFAQRTNAANVWLNFPRTAAIVLTR
jgi:hypothetical protein